MVAARALGYRPELDGLRAVSILAVMLYHSGFITGGFLGVDVFFALSGFLITTLLLAEHSTSDRIDLLRFYGRRALRLLPALLPVVVVAGAAMVLGAASSPSEHGLFVLAVFFYVANWAAILGLPQGMLGHAWSLSIEEQFYVVWPLVLRRLLGASCRMPIIAGAVGLAAVAAVVYRHVLGVQGATVRHLYLGTDARADAVLLGCFTALLLVVRPRLAQPTASLAARAAGVSALAALLGAFWFARFPRDHVHHGASAIAALAACVVILDVLRPGSGLGRLLATPVPVWIGRRSYGLYLWHFPIFFLTESLYAPGLLFDSSMIPVAWLATFVVAAASFRYIEQPALRLRARVAAPLPVAAAVTVATSPR